MKLTLILGILTSVLALGETALAEHAQPGAAQGYYSQQERAEDIRERVQRQREEMRQELQRRRTGSPERREDPCGVQPVGSPPKPGC